MLRLASGRTNRHDVRLRIGQAVWSWLGWHWLYHSRTEVAVLTTGTCAVPLWTSALAGGADSPMRTFPCMAEQRGCWHASPHTAARDAVCAGGKERDGHWFCAWTHGVQTGCVQTRAK